MLSPKNLIKVQLVDDNTLMMMLKLPGMIINGDLLQRRIISKVITP